MTKCTQLASQLVEGQAPAVDSNVDWTGEGDEVDLAVLEDLANEITGRAREWTDRDRDRFEGKVCTQLFEAMSDLPIEVLDDRGFWRYLALRYFWDFIAWREEAPFAAGNHLKYVDAASPTESVLTRMYLRAHAVGGSDYGEIAGDIPKSTDFWRSHVLRVRTGSAPALTCAFASKQASDRLETEVLRDTARRLNRLWTNVVLHTYDDSEAAELIDGLWPDPDD
jgi:hypothetical protein